MVQHGGIARRYSTATNFTLCGFRLTRRRLDPITGADPTLDRLAHSSVRIELRVDSMRGLRAPNSSGQSFCERLASLFAIKQLKPSERDISAREGGAVQNLRSVSTKLHKN